MKSCPGSFIFVWLPLYSTSVRKIQPTRWCQKRPHDFVPSNCGWDLEVLRCFFSSPLTLHRLIWFRSYGFCVFHIYVVLGCNRFHRKFFFQSTKKKNIQTYKHTCTLGKVTSNMHVHLNISAKYSTQNGWYVLDCIANNH